METTSNIYEFESFRLDPDRKCLWQSGSLVSLTPKAFETLWVLVRNSGEVVGKRELLDEVWPDTFVEESTLSQNILTLRKALGPRADGEQFIITVPRRGFRFVAPVHKLNGSNGFSNGNGTAAAVHDPVQAPPTNGHSVTRVPATKTSFPLISAIAGGRLLIGVLGVAWYLTRPGSMVDTKFREFRTSGLVSDASFRSASISPDGKYLSLIEKRGDAERLLVRQINEADAIEVVPPSNSRFLGASFSPDGQYVFYAAYRDGSRTGEAFRGPLLGGPAQLIMKDVDSPVSVSKSGKLAFVRSRPAEGTSEIVTADLDGKNERIVSTRKLDEGYLNASISPDARSIISAANSSVSLARPMELVLIDVASGEQRPLTARSWLWIGQSAWLSDGSGVALLGYGAMSPDLTDEVWFVSVPDGNARMLEAGVNGVFGLSMTDDGNSIVAVKSDKITSYVISPLADLAKESVVITKAGDQSLLPLGADWPDIDRIFYATTENGNADIWSIGVDGGGRKRLTADKYADLQPQVSPDGRYIYFLSNRSGQMSVWRSKTDGTEAQKLTDGGDAFSVQASPDGRSIYYTARADSVFSQHLWRAATDGKDPVRLTTKTTLQPRISPDGKSIACYHPTPEGGPPVLSILNAETGAIVRQFPERKNDFFHEWLKDGRELLVLSRGGNGSSLWRLSAETGEAIPIKAWPNESVFRMAVSPAGDSLFYEKGIAVANVIRLNDASTPR